LGADGDLVRVVKAVELIADRVGVPGLVTVIDPDLRDPDLRRVRAGYIRRGAPQLERPEEVAIPPCAAEGDARGASVLAGLIGHPDQGRIVVGPRRRAPSQGRAAKPAFEQQTAAVDFAPGRAV